MQGKIDRSVATAYCGDAALDYDDARFRTAQGRLFSALEFRQLNRAVRLLEQGARVLEVGCGTARFAGSLAQRGFAVVATDPSADMLEVAAAKWAGIANIGFEQAEGNHLRFADEAFDLVFAIRVANQTESEAYALAMIHEMIRVTRHGGLVLIEFVNRHRPLAKHSRDVKLSFAQIDQVARSLDCAVLSRRGVLVFSQSVLNHVPDALVPCWGMLERLGGGFCWPWASRGYILLRKL